MIGHDFERLSAAYIDGAGVLLSALCYKKKQKALPLFLSKRNGRLNTFRGLLVLGRQVKRRAGSGKKTFAAFNCGPKAKNSENLIFMK